LSFFKPSTMFKHMSLFLIHMYQIMTSQNNTHVNQSIYIFSTTSYWIGSVPCVGLSIASLYWGEISINAKIEHPCPSLLWYFTFLKFMLCFCCILIARKAPYFNPSICLCFPFINYKSFVPQGPNESYILFHSDLSHTLCQFGLKSCGRIGSHFFGMVLVKVCRSLISFLRVLTMYSTRAPCNNHS
jgi:hypothetical protein